MCFSAGASFSAAGVLSIIGLLSVKQVHDKRLYPLAIIPLFFAVQQASEGILWLALSNTISPAFILPATYLFLFFAFLLWPYYISMATLLYEKQALRKKLLYVTLVVGLLVTLYALFCLMTYKIQAEAVACHILYSIKDISFSNYALIPYLVAILSPFFISSIQYLWVFGVTLVISFIVSFTVYTTFLTSTWCFFAALLSVVTYWILRSMKPKQS